MQKRNIFLALLISILALSPLALADEGNETEKELALVDFPSLLSSVMADDDIEGVTHEEVDAIATDLGYEMVVNTATLELYLEGIVDTIADFSREDITEEVEELLVNEDDDEGIRDHYNELEEITELPVVKDITQEIFNNL